MQRVIPQSDKTPLDLLIVGGGIYGAAMVYYAALNGLNVALLEKDDFCRHTSANSQKVIHGGLRYLQSFDVKRVLESIRERQRFYSLFPHLVEPLPCVLPLSGRGTQSREAMRIAFWLYRLFQKCASRKDISLHLDKVPHLLSKQEMRTMFPHLQTVKSRGGALWYDGLCLEPERVVLALLKSAALKNANIANYAKVRQIKRLDESIVLVSGQDRLNGSQFKVKTQKVALCTGPWMKDELGLGDLPEDLKELSLISGVNIVTESLTGGSASIALKPKKLEKSGFLFVLPWKNHSIAGTLWQEGGESPSQSVAKPEFAKQLSGDVHSCYPTSLQAPSIERSHFGYVPGNNDSRKAAADRILSHYQFVDRELEKNNAVLQIVGVKFTTAFDVGLKALGKLFPRQNFPDTVVPETLPVGSMQESPKLFFESLVNQYSPNVSSKHLQLLFSILGEEVPRILDTYVLRDASRKDQQVSYDEILKSLTCFFVQEEMAVSLVDVIYRRLFPGICREVQQNELEIISGEMAALLNWTSAFLEEEIEKFRSSEDLHKY